MRLKASELIELTENQKHHYLYTNTELLERENEEDLQDRWPQIRETYKP